jgi:GT2 family glycosyltransferase
MRMAVIIPAYGLHQITQAAVSDVAREDTAGRHDIDCIVVDNQGGYEPLGREEVLRPGHNLGWLDGTNLGWNKALETGYDAYVLMNNDVRLSPGFFAGLSRAQRLTGAGMVAPAYDSWLAHQRLPLDGPIDEYKPRRVHWRANWVDGTCLFLPAETVAKVGTFDPAFNPHGWGCEVDYSFRVWDAGLHVVITALAFLHHESEATAKQVHGNVVTYQDEALMTAGQVLRTKYELNELSRRDGLDWAIRNTYAPSERRRLLDTVTLETRGRLGLRIPARI